MLFSLDTKERKLIAKQYVGYKLHDGKKTKRSPTSWDEIMCCEIQQALQGKTPGSDDVDFNTNHLCLTGGLVLRVGLLFIQPP